MCCPDARDPGIDETTGRIVQLESTAKEAHRHLGRRLKALEAWASDIEQRLDAIEDRVETIETSIDEIEEPGDEADPE